MNGAPPPLKRIDHVVALVRDLDAAFATYTQHLGFPVSWRVESKDGWRSSAVWLGNASLELLEPSADHVAAVGTSSSKPLTLAAMASSSSPSSLATSTTPSAPCATAAPRSPTQSPAPSLIGTEATASAAIAAPSSAAAAPPA